MTFQSLRDSVLSKVKENGLSYYSLEKHLQKDPEICRIALGNLSLLRFFIDIPPDLVQYRGYR